MRHLSLMALPPRPWILFSFHVKVGSGLSLESLVFASEGSFPTSRVPPVTSFTRVVLVLTIVVFLLLDVILFHFRLLHVQHPSYGRGRVCGVTLGGRSDDTRA